MSLLPPSTLEVAKKSKSRKSKADNLSKKPKLTTQKNKKYTVDGVTKTLEEHCNTYNIRIATALSRIRSGMSAKEALTKPVLTASQQAKQSMIKRREKNPELFRYNKRN